MKAMILAAGRGERMRPLTDTCPKPLLKVHQRALIEWHVLNLVRAGFRDIVINHAHLGHMIETALGDGSRYGAQIRYSAEAEALETAGGVAQALPLLGEAPFLLVSGDIYAPQFDFSVCRGVLEEADPWGVPLPPEQRDLGWLYLVKNPDFHPNGDFALELMTLRNQGAPRYTYANIGVFSPALFAGIAPGSRTPLGPLLRQWADAGRLGGELMRGPWHNLGTPAQLAALNAPFPASA